MPEKIERDTMIIRLHIPGIALHNALTAAAAKACSREKMAHFYADMILAGCKDWHEINAAIQNRWPHGLAYIKTQAWKIAKSNAISARE